MEGTDEMEAEGCSLKNGFRETQVAVFNFWL
jgi:hypothetical protein